MRTSSGGTTSRRARPAGPRVVACAWCAQQGRSHVAVRPPDTRRWYDGSSAFAHALKTAGFASHGMCAVCRPAVAAEWGCPIESAA